jgi:hypothetical protein
MPTETATDAPADEPDDGNGRSRIRAALEKGLDKALAIQQPVVVRLAARVGHGDPGVSPGQAVAALEAHYRRTVVALGAAGGSSSFVPGIGTTAGIVVNVGEVGAFLEATALYCLTMAELHDIRITDLDRRRLLLYAVLLGDAGSEAVRKASERIGKHWAKKIVSGISPAALKQINKVLGHNFVTKYGTKQGILVLGREIPFGIGVGVGAAGNYFLARATVKAARSAFGPAPKSWASDAAAADS